MAPGIFAPGVSRTDAPQEFDGQVTYTGTTAFNGPVSFSGAITSSGVAAALSSSDPVPTDVGLVAWTFDPTSTGTAGQIVASGKLTLGAVWLRQPTLISKISTWITVVGATLTSSQNFLAIYNTAGTQVAATADQSVNWTSLGANTASLVTPTTLQAGMYWVAILANGTTAPTFASASPTTAATSGLGASNITLSAASWRFATSGTAQTALPASITPSSNVITSAIPFWSAIS